MLPARRTGDDSDMGKALFDVLDELDCPLLAVGGHDQQTRLGNPRRLQQTRAQRVAIIDLNAEFPHHLDMGGRIVEHDGAVAIHHQKPLDDLAETAVQTRS